MFAGETTFGRNSEFGRDSNSDLNSLQSHGMGTDRAIGGGLRFRDTISELYDDGEKDAVFRSSKKRGGAMHDFNETLKNSPDLFSKMKGGFKPFPQPEMARLFATKAPTDFQPLQSQTIKATHFEPTKKEGESVLEINKRFGIRPKKEQFCKRHRQTPIEFFCLINSEFYCRLCATDHEGHGDECVQEAASDVQLELNQLKHLYLVKKANLMDRLQGHQKKMEDFFNVFYQVLDTERNKVLQ